MSGERPARGRLWMFAIVSVVLSTAFALGAAELALRWLAPQPAMSPRWNYSARYCSLPFPSTRMVHERPGRWRFIYTINRDGHRGPEPPPDPGGGRPGIVVLGDSYTFGMGVDDGEEYAAVLRRAMGDTVPVLNLGVGGWGLTQQIRRFYEYGLAYRPFAVVLQFSANDPEDDLRCPVTRLQEGRFEFQDSDEGVFWVKRYLSHSPLQRSQLYNLVRDAGYGLLAAGALDRGRAALDPAAAGAGGSAEERLYAALLEGFAADLSRRGMRLVFLTVNGQTASFPIISRALGRLDAERKLEFVDAADWLRGLTNYGSPEGHLWGRAAHAAIGARLAELLRARRPAKE